jgi:hypothetical protein
MTNSLRFARFSRVPGIAFAVLVLSIGKPNLAQAEHAVSPHESAAAVALNCFETWLDRPADFIAAVECMYKAWQIASCNHSRILTASLIKIVVRDIIMHVLVWMWEFGIPDARPETPRYADSTATSFVDSARAAACLARCGGIHRRTDLKLSRQV